ISRRGVARRGGKSEPGVPQGSRNFAWEEPPDAMNGTHDAGPALAVQQKSPGSGQAHDRMIAQRDLFGHQVTYRDEQALVAVDAEFDFKARLSLFGGRVGVQEGRVLLVDPEVITAILLVGCHV